ncbi:hypothetical protein MKX08_007918 [Trichoderma sp. CBMAI-0020]|nr:hypothetical protein MKX08_007918 [Trichoderma sp. CBMAI-0020]
MLFYIILASLNRHLACQSKSPCPPIPELGITIKANPVLLEAHAYYAQKMDKSVVDLRAFHVLGRPAFPTASSSTVLLHDFGLSTDKALISNDKRFEIDGAKIARQFLKDRGGDAWTPLPNFPDEMLSTSD